VRGIDLLLKAQRAEPVNLGNPQEMTVLEMARLICALTESKSEIVFRALPEDDPKVRQPSIALAQEKLGWSPQVDVRQALERTIAWFRETHAAAGC
jgi:dTDP-glucose 4,6-dehydratase